MTEAWRRFSWADQRSFAMLSGDWNPMHMDPNAARRTLAGACVVHGVQSLLWMLDKVATQMAFSDVNSVEVSFTQFLYVDESVRMSITAKTAARVQLDLRCGPTLISRCHIRFGPRSRDEPVLAFSSNHRTVFSAEDDVPQDRSWEQMIDLEGDVQFATPQENAEPFYPELCGAIGSQRVAGILALTRLVGMVSPGMHSTFHRLAIRFVNESVPGHSLRFVTETAEPRFRLATLAVRAPGIAGMVSASRRNPPVPQHISDLGRDRAMSLCSPSRPIIGRFFLRRMMCPRIGAGSR